MRTSRSSTRASFPMSTRARPLLTLSRITRAASSAVVEAIRRSKLSAMAAASSPSATVALRAIAVLMPPGCTVVTLTGCLATAISWFNASVNPRTANFAAL
nr:hypothetical protein CPGR_01289 [Mycolicibacter nonchromogenicus]